MRKIDLDHVLLTLAGVGTLFGLFLTFLRDWRLSSLAWMVVAVILWLRCINLHSIIKAKLKKIP